MITLTSPKEQWMRKQGWLAINYSGRMADAPRTMKAYMRELSAGWYVYNPKTKAIWGPVATPYSNETDAFEDGFFYVLNGMLFDVGVEIYEEDDGFWAKKKSRFGRDQKIFRSASETWYAECMKAALHEGFINDDMATVMLSDGLVPSIPVSYAALSTTKDTYGIYTASGNLIAIVSHGMNDELGQPEHDAALFASASRMYAVLNDFADAVDYDQVAEIQQRAIDILKGVHG